MPSSHKNKFTLSITILLCIFCYATSDTKDKDKEECTEQLVGLATCLPYVGGTAKSPTPDCCSGLKQVMATNKKCLCVIIKDRNDPDLGLTINVTLALGLPTVCHVPANVSQCPALLHLDPNSAEAKVFSDFGHTSNATSTTASSPIASVKTNTTSTGNGNSNKGMSAAAQSSDSGKTRQVGWKMIVGQVLLIWCLMSKIMLLIY